MTVAMADHSSGKTSSAPRAGHVSCHDCSVAQLCLPVSLNETEIGFLEGIIKRNRPLHKHEHLIRAGDPVQHVYALRSGALKTYLLNPDGVDQIIGFHLPSELIGLDALGAERYPSHCVALDTSMVCAIPLHQLEELAGQIPGLRSQLLHTLSRGIHDEHEYRSHTRESAEQRLASFLLNLSVRYSKRGLSASKFVLPMSRSDIGNYLGMTTETVSRLFTRFRDQCLIATSGHEVHLLDTQALCQQGVHRHSRFPASSRCRAYRNDRRHFVKQLLGRAAQHLASALMSQGAHHDDIQLMVYGELGYRLGRYAGQQMAAVFRHCPALGELVEGTAQVAGKFISERIRPAHGAGRIGEEGRRVFIGRDQVQRRAALLGEVLRHCDDALVQGRPLGIAA